MINRKAFTLIELIVSIAIIGMLVTLMLTNFKTSKDNLPLALEDFVSSIQDVRAKANFGQVIDICYMDGEPVGLCEPGCLDCRKESPIGFGISAPLCSTPPCEYFLFTEVYRRMNANLFFYETLKILGSTTIEKICLAREDITMGWPQSPPFISQPSWRCNTDGGWGASDSTNPWFCAEFNGFYAYLNDYNNCSSPHDRFDYIAILLKNIKNNNQAYVYLSRDGLISSGLLK